MILFFSIWFVSILFLYLFSFNMILFLNMMTFWPSTSYSDFPTDQTFHQFHELNIVHDFHRIMSGFYGTFPTGVACKQGALTLPDTWFLPPFLDLLMLKLLWPDFTNLSCLFSTLHLEYLLVLSRFCLRYAYV